MENPTHSFYHVFPLTPNYYATVPNHRVNCSANIYTQQIKHYFGLFFPQEKGSDCTVLSPCQSSHTFMVMHSCRPSAVSIWHSCSVFTVQCYDLELWYDSSSLDSPRKCSWWQHKRSFFWNVNHRLLDINTFIVYRLLSCMDCCLKKSFQSSSD